MIRRPSLHLLGLAFSGNLACTAPANRGAKYSDSGEALPGLEQVFECGELDFADAWALISELRIYEVACEEIPPGDRWPDVPWHQLARQYARKSRCPANPEQHARGDLLLQGCGLEAAVNLSIHGLRTAGCPPLDGESGYLNLAVGGSRMLEEASYMIYEVCVSDDVENDE